MQKYLLNMKMDVADEDDAVLLTVIDEDTYNRLKRSKVAANWGQIIDDLEYIPFSDIEDGDIFEAYATVTPITDEEANIFERLNVYANAGSFYFIEKNNEKIELM